MSTWRIAARRMGAGRPLAGAAPKAAGVPAKAEGDAAKAEGAVPKDAVDPTGEEYAPAAATDRPAGAPLPQAAWAVGGRAAWRRVSGRTVGSGWVRGLPLREAVSAAGSESGAGQEGGWPKPAGWAPADLAEPGDAAAGWAPAGGVARGAEEGWAEEGWLEPGAAAVDDKTAVGWAAAGPVIAPPGGVEPGKAEGAGSGREASVGGGVGSGRGRPLTWPAAGLWRSQSDHSVDGRGEPLRSGGPGSSREPYSAGRGALAGLAAPWEEGPGELEGAAAPGVGEAAAAGEAAASGGSASGGSGECSERSAINRCLLLRGPARPRRPPGRGPGSPPARRSRRGPGWKPASQPCA